MYIRSAAYIFQSLVGAPEEPVRAYVVGKSAAVYHLHNGRLDSREVHHYVVFGEGVHKLLHCLHSAGVRKGNASHGEDDYLLVGQLREGFFETVCGAEVEGSRYINDCCFSVLEVFKVNGQTVSFRVYVLTDGYRYVFDDGSFSDFERDDDDGDDDNDDNNDDGDDDDSGKESGDDEEESDD